MTVSLKTVTLNDTHRQLGAKMVPFAGYDMPVRYSSDLDEHHTVRRAVAFSTCRTWASSDCAARRRSTSSSV